MSSCAYSHGAAILGVSDVLGIGICTAMVGLAVVPGVVLELKELLKIWGELVNRVVSCCGRRMLYVILLCEHKMIMTYFLPKVVTRQIQDVSRWF